MSNKGFTLVELLAVIIIMSIISLMGIPSLANIMANGHRTCDNYKDAMITASKSYILKEGKDIKENPSYGNNFSLDLNNDLIAGGYMEEYSDSRTDIGYKNGSNIIKGDALVNVTYDSNTNTYTYKPNMVCLKKSTNNEVLASY